MKTELIVSCYQEEFLLPFFLKHYEGVSRITFLFGYDSTDKSLDIIKEWADKHPETDVFLADGTEREGINDQLRIDRINELYKKSEADWVILLDVDEFIIGIDEEYLMAIPKEYNYLSCKVFQMHTHVTDKPLDVNIPVHKQRRHGYEYNHGRPVILRGKHNLTLEIGKHSIHGDKREYPHKPIMLHWQMIDKDVCLNRRLKDRKPRFSNLNKQRGWGIHEVNNTEQELLAEFKAHENDLIVI